MAIGGERLQDTSNIHQRLELSVGESPFTKKEGWVRLTGTWLMCGFQAADAPSSLNSTTLHDGFLQTTHAQKHQDIRWKQTSH